MGYVDTITRGRLCRISASPRMNAPTIQPCQRSGSASKSGYLPRNDRCLRVSIAQARSTRTSPGINCRFSENVASYALGCAVKTVTDQPYLFKYLANDRVLVTPVLP